MRASRIETVLQWCSDVERSTDWYRRFLGVETTPYEAPYFRLDDGCYLILGEAAAGTGRGGTGVWFAVDDVHEAWRERTAQGFTFSEERPFEIPPGWLITTTDPDGNIVGLIDNTHGGMPRSPAGGSGRGTGDGRGGRPAVDG